ELDLGHEVAVPAEAIGASLPVQGVGGEGGEGLGHRHVGPQAARQDQLEAAAQPRPGAEDLPPPVLLDEAGGAEPQALAVEVELQEGGVGAQVGGGEHRGLLGVWRNATRQGLAPSPPWRVGWGYPKKRNPGKLPGLLHHLSLQREKQIRTSGKEEI